MGLFMGASLVTVVGVMVYLFLKLRSFAVRQRLVKFGEKTLGGEKRGKSHTIAYGNSVYL